MNLSLKIPWISKDEKIRQNTGVEFYGIRDQWNQHNQGAVKWDNVNTIKLQVGSSSITIPISIANGGTNSTTALNNSRVMISSSGKIVEGGASSVNSAGFVIGSIAQFVSGTVQTSTTSTTSATYVTTGTTVTITTKGASNLVFLIASGELTSGGPSTIRATIFKDSSNLMNANGQIVEDNGIDTPASMTCVDTPGVGTFVYSVQIKVTGAVSGSWNRLGGDAFIRAIEIWQ